MTCPRAHGERSYIETQILSFLNFFLQLTIFRILRRHPTLSSQLKPNTFPLQFILVVYFIPMHLSLVKTLLSLGEIIQRII